MTLTPEQERWAFAARLMEIHGDDIGSYFVDRVADLTDKGDYEGVRFWISIAALVMKLSGPDEGAKTQ